MQRRLCYASRHCLGVGLLAYLLTTVKFSALAENAKAIGWGMLLVIALGGFSHVIKTWAWRLTLLGEARKVSFGRTLGLRLIVRGDRSVRLCRNAWRRGGSSIITGLRSLCRWRHKLGGTGSHSLHSCRCGSHDQPGLSGSLLAFRYPMLSIIYASGPRGWIVVASWLPGQLQCRRRWPVLSGPARAAARIPWFRNWVHSKEATLKAAEQRIVDVLPRSAAERSGAACFSTSSAISSQSSKFT